MPIKLTKALEYGLIVLGAFMLICTGALCIKQRVSSKVIVIIRKLMLQTFISKKFKHISLSKCEWSGHLAEFYFHNFPYFI